MVHAEAPTAALRRQTKGRGESAQGTKAGRVQDQANKMIWMRRDGRTKNMGGNKRDGGTQPKEVQNSGAAGSQHGKAAKGGLHRRNRSVVL